MITLTASSPAAMSARVVVSVPQASTAKPAVRMSEPMYPEGHRASEHASAVSASGQRGSGRQAKHDRVDDEGDCDFDSDHEAENCRGDDGENGNHR